MMACVDGLTLTPLSSVQCKKAKALLESLSADAKVYELDEMDEGSDWQVRRTTHSVMAGLDCFFPSRRLRCEE